MKRTAAAIVLALSGACASGQGHPDSCQAQIPRSLADALAAAFPGYRAPLETDNAPEDIQANRANGGTGCLGVGIADFTGESKKDYLIGATALKGSAGLALIALPRKGGWRFQRIASGTEQARFQQYVEAMAPGRYERAATRTAPLELGEAKSLDCPNWSARVGTLQATQIVYCYQGGRWLHVWTSGS